MIDHLRLLLGIHPTRTDESGTSAAEYGLLIAGIAALIVVVVVAFSDARLGF